MGVPGRVAAAAMLLGVAGCHVILVTDYDATFDTELTSAQRDVDALMSRIADAPSEPYAASKAEYAKVTTDLDGLAVRAASHASNADMVQSVARLQHSFGAFQAEHAAGPVSARHARDELQIMNHEFQILMAEELAKQSGKH
jgi:hypothetical protein